MKKLIGYLLIVFSLLAVACVKEKGGPEQEPVVLAEVPVDIGNEDLSGDDATKSQVSVEAERFQKAALFAFYASGSKAGKIITVDGSPIVKETTSKTFSWALPLNVKMNIYVIANYGDLDLSSQLASTSLTVSDLESLTFSCANSTALRNLELEGYGLPMAGIKYDVTLSAGNTALSLKVKKLFARYDFYFDASAFTSAGYSVKSLYISACKSNTEIPYFVEGYQQTSVSKLNTVDLGTPDDIEELDYASSGHAITLYFLENCQGDKSGASHWYEVAGSGMSGLNLCSYIDLGIKVTDADGNDANYFYWIYLGDDCTTNFDVRRNEYHTIKLTLKTPDVIPPSKTNVLALEAASSSAVAGSSIDVKVYYDTYESGTRTSRSDITSNTSVNWSCTSSNSSNVTFPSRGKVQASAAGTYTIKASYNGGSGVVSNTIDLTFTPALYITITNWDLSWDWNSYGSGSAKTAKVSTNISRSDLSVSSDNDSNVTYTLASTANSDGTYNLSMYWNSSNTSTSSTRTANVTVSGSGTSDYARMTQGKKPEDVTTYRLGVSPSSITLEEGASSSVPTLYKEKWINGEYDSRTTFTGSASWSVKSGSTYFSVNSSTGVVTAKSNGAGSGSIEVTITDTSFDSDYRKASIPVTVTEKEDVITYRISSITLSSSTLDYGETATATVKRQKYVNGYASGSEETVDNSNFNWSSDDTSVATVSGGTVTASSSKEGFANITATLKSTAPDYSSYESGYKSKSVEVTVSHTAVITIELEISGNSSATVGTSIPLTVYKVTKADNVETGRENITSSVSFSRKSGSSNVSVNSSGSVSAVNPGGTAVIEASYDGKTATKSVTFSLNSGFEWITSNNQSIDEGSTITLEFWSSNNSVTFSSNDSKLTVGTPSFVSQSGTSNAWAYKGSVVLTAGSVDDDVTVTVSSSASSTTRTVLVVALWEPGFEWIDTNITVDAGSSTTARYRCGSSSPTIDFNGATIAGLEASPNTEPVVNGNYRYSGTATISADSSVANNTSVTLRGISNGNSATTGCTVSKPDVITYKVEITGETVGSHHFDYYLTACLYKYVNDVKTSEVLDFWPAATWSWTSDSQSNVTVRNTAPNGGYAKVNSVFYSSTSGTISSRTSKITASVVYQGVEYSAYTTMQYKPTYHISATLEGNSGSDSLYAGNIRAVLNVAVSVSVCVKFQHPTGGYNCELLTNAGTKYSSYDYFGDITKSQLENISVTCNTANNDPYVYDEDEKCYYYF